MKKRNSHPAGVVRPPSREAGKDGGNCRPTAASKQGDGRWKVGASIVVQVETVRATTKFRAVPGANHGAIAGRRRRAAIEDGRAAILGKVTSVGKLRKRGRKVIG